MGGISSLLWSTKPYSSPTIIIIIVKIIVIIE